MNQEEKYFLTDTIFRYKNQLYFQEENKKEIKINKKNWIKYLKEYGWEKISKNFQKNLNLKEKQKIYYAVLDCGGNGDCMFHCISEALNEPYNISSKLYDTQFLRNTVSEGINESNFFIILENYKIEKDNNEFQGEWEPNDIKSIEELQNEIKKCGDNFWGDHILLQLIQKKLNINILLFKTNIYDILSENDSENLEIQYLNEGGSKTIILYYISELHYQLVGYFNGKVMKTFFYKKEIPEELQKYII